MEGFAPVRAYAAWVDGPFGRVFLVKTKRGLCRVSFRKSEADLLSQLEDKQLLAEMAPAKLDEERRQLDEYFSGKRREFEMPIDLLWVTPFQRQVLNAIRKLGFGELCRYKDVARWIGRPKASRAVGNALGSNPLAIVVPCHRVVASGGAIGGYTGGLDIKRTLMGIEGIDAWTASNRGVGT
jgi:methylated-DNA-[protein]-cysteine S-methyltransferase